jgi:hypothetical protein
MTNGIDHVQGGSSAQKPCTSPKPDAKPEAPATGKPTHGGTKQSKS